MAYATKYIGFFLNTSGIIKIGYENSKIFKDVHPTLNSLLDEDSSEEKFSKQRSFYRIMGGKWHVYLYETITDKSSEDMIIMLHESISIYSIKKCLKPLYDEPYRDDISDKITIGRYDWIFPENVKDSKILIMDGLEDISNFFQKENSSRKNIDKNSFNKIIINDKGLLTDIENRYAFAHLIKLDPNKHMNLQSLIDKRLSNNTDISIIIISMY